MEPPFIIDTDCSDILVTYVLQLFLLGHENGT